MSLKFQLHFECCQFDCVIINLRIFASWLFCFNSIGGIIINANVRNAIRVTLKTQIIRTLYELLV